MFQGFSPQTADFLWGLAFNNERPWFLAHKAEFEEFLNKPLHELADDTLKLMRERGPDDDYQLHVARIYRDARRLFGRGPYKEELWFSIQSGSTKMGGPMFWFAIRAESYSYGAGFWGTTPAQAQIYRKMIDANPARFESMVRNIADYSEYRLWGEEYKRKKGERGELLDPWYNRKSVSVGYEYEFGEELFSPELPNTLSEAFGRLTPMYRFFRDVYTALPPE